MSAVHPLQTSFWLACDALIWRHCAPWELDEAATAWGYTIGPCEAQDLVGLDHVLAARTGEASPILPRMVAEGRLGKRAGWGYYRYPGGGGAVTDPLIEDLVHEEAWFAKVTRTEVEGPVLIAMLHDAVGALLKSAGAAVAPLVHLPTDRWSDL